MTSPDELQITLRIALRDLIAYWGEMIPDGPSSKRLGTIGRSGRVLEPHLYALSVRRETTEILNGWARIVIEERDLPGRVDGTDAVAMARLLDAHHDWLAAHEAGEDAVGEIVECARKVHGVARPRSREDAHFLGYCSVCATRLDATREQLSIICPECGVEHQRRDVRQSSLDVVRDVLCTAKEAAVMGLAVGVEVKPATIVKWQQRGRVEALACDLEGRALRYRFGDVETLAARGVVA